MIVVIGAADDPFSVSRSLQKAMSSLKYGFQNDARSEASDWLSEKASVWKNG